MRNLIDAYATAVGTWTQNTSSNALRRTVRALDAMRAGTYGAPEFSKDVYEYWRDLADFRAQAALGIVPTASLDISAWAGSSVSNFVQVPVGALLMLTPVVNPQTGHALGGLDLHNNNGENAVRVRWTAATAGSAPTGPDKNGLFQGAICHNGTGELIATVHVLTRLP